MLSSFDCDKYRFGVISVENNFSKHRDKTFDLLTGKGYVRKLQELSEFEDWYVCGHQRLAATAVSQLFYTRAEIAEWLFLQEKSHP